MRRLMKFLHTVGSVGFMGSAASLLALHAFLPAPAATADYALLRAAMAGVADWIFLPSLAMVLLSGLLAIAAHTGFQHAGWVWVKLLFGIVVFEGGLVAVHGPIGAEADLAAGALAGTVDAARLGQSISAETGSLWVMMALSALNIYLGVWRPNFQRRRKPDTPAPAPSALAATPAGDAPQS